MSKAKWAILGPGNIAEEFVRALMESNAEIYAVGSRSYARAKKFADSYNIKKVYGNYEDMLRDDEIDVVYISTPHCNHYYYIMESLKNNKNVLCEKAITVNGKQLKKLIDLAEKNKLILAEAMTIYHMPLYKKLHNIVASGQIGKLKMIQVSFGSCKEYDVKSRFFNKELAGGALLDIGTYALSFARYFLSSNPNEVLTTVKKFETGVDEESGIVLKNSMDEMAVISLTMRAKMPKVGVIAGDLGYITVEDFPRADKAVINYNDGRTEVLQVGEKPKALNYEIEYINSCISNEFNENTLNLSVDVMNIMDAIRKQWKIKYPFE
ncbi:MULTISPECIES: Gfo/Idh/MocA family protein [Clostridium]|uniref:Gfo/Idh/MocA family protein n=1 Tax=Clostridium TaxID=1485 RepID=UPI00069D8D95|nr:MULTISPECIES: Gfo/Idh/MocA family oxidoreductase [Clostridium]KOF56556.1 oxidoreductase [Clostridium sp. DMHC 10]MCD2347121.1 Gfo/Idh/MocA family oxidoreductase [Clostridium guangxiense]